MDKIFLTIVITICLSLCSACSVLFWFKERNKELKLSLIYLISVLFFYQLSTLLGFYAPSGIFRLLIYIKIISAFLLKTAILLFVAIYLGKKPLIKLFSIIHLISFLIVAAFLNESFRNTIVTFGPMNNAYYGTGALIYTIISSIIYIAAGILFYNSGDVFKRKKRYLIFLLLFITLNVIILSSSTFSFKNVLTEKMHIYILFILLAILFRSTPFFARKDFLGSVVNIIEGINESIIIFDRQDRVGYIHNVFKDIDLTEHIDELIGVIDKSVLDIDKPINKTNIYLEGEISLIWGKTRFLHYKISPLYYKKVYIGKIIVLRDITHYNNLLKELQEKNALLQEAFEKEKEYIQTIRRLSSEEERARILRLVNNIAGEYITQLKSQLKQLEDIAGNDSDKESIKEKNEELLDLTRKTIKKIRGTVKKLYNKDRVRRDRNDKCIDS